MWIRGSNTSKGKQTTVPVCIVALNLSLDHLTDAVLEIAPGNALVNVRQSIDQEKTDGAGGVSLSNRSSHEISPTCIALHQSGDWRNALRGHKADAAKIHELGYSAFTLPDGKSLGF